MYDIDQMPDPATQVRTYIQEGGFAPGARLPAERSLTETLGLSRATLRKALDVLEREGLIWRHVGRGTFVSQERPTGGDGPLVELGLKLTPFKMMRARISLEPAIAREAALNASHANAMAMQAALDGCVAAASWHEYEGQDDRLHRAIAQATDNLLLLTLFDQLNEARRAVAWGSVERTTDRPPRDHTSFAEHRTIVAAIRARDPLAADAAMRAHLRSVSARLFEGE